MSNIKKLDWYWRSGGAATDFAKDDFYSFFQIYSQEDEATALLDLNENYNATNSGGVFVPDTFFKSNAIDQYVDTGFNPNADALFGLDDCFFGFYIHNNDHPISGTPVIFDNGNCSIRLNGTAIEYKVNSGTYSSYTYEIPDGALIIAYRDAEGTQKLNINGVDVASGSVTSTSKPNGTFKLGQSYAGRWVCSFAGKASEADFADLYSKLLVYISSLSIYYPFRFWAAFEEPDATPIAEPLPIYSKDLMTVEAQKTNCLVIDSNVLKTTISSSVSENKLKGKGIPRKRARTIAFRIKFLSTGTGAAAQIGFYQAAAGNPSNLIVFSGGKIFGSERFGTHDINFTFATDVFYTCFVVLRDSGAYYFIQDGVNYYLLFAANNYNYSPIYPWISLGGSATQLEWLREKQLGGLLLDEWPLLIDGTDDATNGFTFTHGAAGWIVFRLQTQTSSALIDIRFRIQDANNYLQLTISSSNVIKLYRVDAGVPTDIGGTAPNPASAQEFKIFLNGSDVRVFGSATSPTLFAVTESAFTSETDGEVVSQGTGGNITYLKALPFGVTDNDLLSQFEEISSEPEPSQSDIIDEEFYVGP